jgi:hypothetical protein
MSPDTSVSSVNWKQTNSAEEGVGATASEVVTRSIDEQETKFDDFIQNILKSSSAAGDGGDGGAAAADTRGAPATLSLAEKLSALSTVRGMLCVYAALLVTDSNVVLAFAHE